MKNIIFGVLIFLGLRVFSAAEGILDDPNGGHRNAEMSYAFGMYVASDLLETGLEFNYSAFSRGFRAVMEKEKTRYTMEEAVRIIQESFEAAFTETGERNRNEGAAFLAENGLRPSVITTQSGLQYEIIVEGSGEIPGPADTVLVHYRGMTLDGNVFDATYDEDDEGTPMELPLDNVIAGWSEGLRMMREGGKTRLFIPPELAYGERGAGGIIGPNAVIIFDVELLGIVKAPEAE